MAKIKADKRQNATQEERYLSEIENDIYQLGVARSLNDTDAINNLLNIEGSEC